MSDSNVHILGFEKVRKEFGRSWSREIRLINAVYNRMQKAQDTNKNVKIPVASLACKVWHDVDNP